MMPAVRALSTRLGTVAALLLLASAGCGPDSGPAPGAHVPVRAPAGPAAYRPPENGVLTPAQVETYLAVRRKVVEDARSGKLPAPDDAGLSAALGPRGIEMAAARELKANPEEMLWVEERILEAEAAAGTARLDADALALLEKTLAGLRSQRAAAADDPTRALLDEQIRTFEGEAARVKAEAARKEPPGVAANMRLVARFHEKLAALDAEIARLAPTPAAALAPTPAPTSAR